MAEAFFRKLARGQWRCKSAGTKPTGYVHPLAIEVMLEDDVDIASHTSKSTEALILEEWTYVITVCDSAAEACPVFSEADRLLHWPFPDPASVSGSREVQLIAFRETRDAIKRRVSEFLSELNED